LKPVLKLKKLSALKPEVKLPVRLKTGTLTQLVGIANYKGPTISLQQMKDARRPRTGN
jgi:hypothetical protein